MSVAEISMQQFADVATSLWYSSDCRHVFLSFRERYLELACATHRSTTVTRREVLAFVERLYIANRLAHAYQYPDTHSTGTIEIPRLRENDLEGHILPLPELLAALQDIEYNLYTNSGRAFLGNEDMERLQRLIHTCMGRLAERACAPVEVAP